MRASPATELRVPPWVEADPLRESLGILGCEKGNATTDEKLDLDVTSNKESKVHSIKVIHTRHIVPTDLHPGRRGGLLPLEGVGGKK